MEEPREAAYARIRVATAVSQVSHFVSTLTSVHSGMDHTVLPANYTIPASTS